MLKIIKTKGHKDSDLFTKAIQRKAKELDYMCEVIEVEPDIPSIDYCKLCEKNNYSPDIVLPLLPLPENVSTSRLRDTLEFCNIDSIGIELKRTPITPAAIVHKLIELEQENHIFHINKCRVVILNRTKRIGIPLALDLIALGATVTVCHSQTQDLAEIVKAADIVITATGKSDIISADMIMPNQLWIDCSGDVNDECKQKLEADSYFSMRDVGSWTLKELFMRYRNYTP